MSKSYTAVIADDEPLLRRHLDKVLAEVWPELEVIALVGDGEQAIVAIETQQPDVVFLDIKMPGLDGMGVAKRLKAIAKAPLVVFTTAYDEYAVKAFELNAVDYLLKPINESRLQIACDKLQRRLEEKTASTEPKQISDLLQQIQQITAPTEPSYLHWIRASLGEDIHMVAVANVQFFKSEDKYVLVYAKDLSGEIKEYLIRMSLKELLSQLNPNEFWQIHRSTVVNVAAIEKVKKDFAGRMSVHIAGNKLAVSRASQALFKGM